MEPATATLPLFRERPQPSSVRSQAELGQFMTPRNVADFMSGMFQRGTSVRASLLDAGAGKGSLSVSFIDRWLRGELGFNKLKLTTFEIDPSMCGALARNLSRFSSVENLELNMVFSDFVEHAVDILKSGVFEPFSHCILNPPYKKIHSSSRHRALLRTLGLEMVNLYSGFVALCLLLLADRGELVAIVPRSFCNGLYYKPFRKFLLENASIRGIHLFAARNSVFSGDKVLQENIIVHLERNGIQGDVKISTSTDATMSDLSSFSSPFEEIVLPTDQNQFIHIPTNVPARTSTIGGCLQSRLHDLDLDVCTGPVVDFRVREFLRVVPESDCVPLLYPFHFANDTFVWPRRHFKKPNALKITPATKKMLLPKGYYVVMRRFSSKEEPRRIVAHLVDPQLLNTDYIAFENHLNVIHSRRGGLDKDVASGLVAYLNTDYVDSYFRRFSGHTQVNATDIRSLHFPSLQTLRRLSHSTGSVEEVIETLSREAS